MSTENNDMILEVRDLEVIYKNDFETVYPLNKVSFSLHKGETMGLVGETGAGKTTTALSILRLLPKNIGKVTGGSITLDGKDILNLKESEMRRIRGDVVSMIFQDPMTSLNPTMTVGEQIAEALELHNESGRSKSQIQERVGQMLELVGIQPERKDDFPHQFSGGMKQRVVIAIALACDPKLLIADEPTTALDVTIQSQVLAMMQDLKHKLNTAMILITHDLGIVAQICDTVAVMYAGEIIEYGTMEDIYTGDAHHPYTVGLFGSIPNLDVPTKRLSPIAGLMPDPTDLPKGCKFHPRCPKATERCREEDPAVIHSGTHLIKCHLFDGKEESL